MVSVPWVSGPCADPRLPALAGEWAVGCSALKADRAQNLRTGERITLRHAAEHVALADGVVYGKPGLWKLEEGGTLRQKEVLRAREFEQLATDGTIVALTTEQDVQVGDLFGNRRRHLLPAPAPWYPPAVGAGRVAWVVHDGDEGIWWLEPGAREATPLADGEGHERHVALSGTHVAWIEDRAVVVQDLSTGEERRLRADAHTARGLTLEGGIACWEQWTGTDVDVACSDGVTVQRPRHQRNPSRHGRWLMVVEEGQALVLEFPQPAVDTLGL